jgi:hypothetical protein
MYRGTHNAGPYGKDHRILASQGTVEVVQVLSNHVIDAAYPTPDL